MQSTKTHSAKPNMYEERCWKVVVNVSNAGVCKVRDSFPCYYTLEYNVPEFEAVILRLGPKKNKIHGAQLSIVLRGNPQQGCRRQQCPALPTTWHIFNLALPRADLGYVLLCSLLPFITSSHNRRKFAFQCCVVQQGTLFKVPTFVSWIIREILTLSGHTSRVHIDMIAGVGIANHFL